ncbi:T9SS type A sorting domain-containing protein [bacterium]|nr:T9SS type A sorting domain-containing protein [bacterium]
MRTRLSIITLFLSLFALGQELSNPFEKHKNQYNSFDLIATWLEPGTGIQEQIFGYNWIAQLNEGTPWQTWTRFTDLSPVKTAGSDAGVEMIYIESGNFNGDERDDIFYLILRNNTYEIGASQQTTTYNRTDSTHEFTLKDAIFTTSNIGTASLPDLAVGDLDGDGIEEVVLCAVDNSGQLLFEVVTFTSSGDSIIATANFTETYDYTYSSWSGTHSNSICIVDVDGDGNDEICYAGLENNTTNSDVKFNVFLRVFDLEKNTNGEFGRKRDYKVVVDDTSLRSDPINTDGSLGYIRTAMQNVRSYHHIKDTGSESIFIAFAFDYTNVSGGYSYDWLRTYTIDINKTFDAHDVKKGPFTWGHDQKFETNTSFELETGDVNDDGIDDLVLLTYEFYVYSFDTATGALQATDVAGSRPTGDLEDAGQESNDRFEIGDIDRDGRDDIVCMSKSFDGGTSEHEIFLEAFTLDENLNIERRGQYSKKFYSGYTYLPYGFDMGNLDGTDLKLGDPVTITDCEFYRPAVIMDCVPYLFDEIGNKVYDLSGCGQSPNTCGNEVKIENSSTQGQSSGILLSTSYTESESANLSYAYEGIGGGASVDQTTGNGFGHSSENGIVENFSFNESSKSDDRIKGHVFPFRMIEYPVLNMSNDTTSWIITVIPSPLIPAGGTFDGRDVVNYIPNHEVGNLLSYPKSTDTESIFYDRISDVPSTLLWTPNPISVSVAGAGGANLASEINQSWSDWTSTMESGTFEANVGVSGFGVGGGYSQSSTYKFEEMQVYSQYITSMETFSVYAAPLSEIGYNFTLTPYLYLTQDRAIRLGMAVDIPNSGAENIVDIYGSKVDPALNLPYRLDSLRGVTNRIAEHYNRTKSIRFNYVNPNPGDTLTAYIRVFNYSLKAMNSAVPFELYSGDPENGGTIITDVNGETRFNSIEVLEGQGRNVVDVSFVVTNQMVQGADSRIYIKLDPDNEFDEVHERNNIGWTNLGYPCNIPNDTVTILDIETVGDNFEFLVYPNPTAGNSHVNFQNTLQNLEGKVTLDIYDIQGNLVYSKPFVNRTYSRFSVDISSLPSGMFIFQLKTEYGEIHNGKIIVTK